ncbi:transferase [Lithospermum erythrorhizon]|uniref:Glycosyltransferase n=1 Tax=Lithospermum erythrorhizon TaxID=34254 RepID=A0AAV3RQ52_LITER
MATTTKKPHAVLIAWPAQGHVNPLMRFAKLLYTRGFHITFVHTEFNYSRLIRSNGPDSVKGLPDFRYETIPDGTPPSSNPDATQDIPSVCASLRKNALGPFKKLLDKLNADPEVPQVTCVVADGVMTFAVRAAEILGIPGVNLVTHSTFSFVGYLFYTELKKRGIFPFKNDDYLTDGTLDEQIEITDKIKMRLRDLPSFFQSTDPEEIMFHFMELECWDCLKADALLLSTFDEFEQDAIEAIKTKYKCFNVFPVGPLSLMEEKHVPENINNQFISSLWKQDPRVFEWLDSRAPESVLFVNYGCVAVMTERQFQELAWGIANSKKPFLWIVRPDVVKDGSATLSEEFLEETKERGFITTWCAQEQVLRHPAVGAFFTHCGWNSMTESICGGVPVICWPWNADQMTNCYCSCNIWGIGMEVDPDVKREKISRQIVEMMQGEKGKEMRRNAQEWKRKAEISTDAGGSSLNNLDEIIKNFLLP